MKRIGLLSDTHGYLDETLLTTHFVDCDEIWHAGDIGEGEVLEQLQSYKPLRIVFGNIDTHIIRDKTIENERFEIEGFSVWITHIGGYPPKYNALVKKQLKEETPDIFICGHSHMLRVMRDSALNNMLYINPGAAGLEGFHKMRTALKFTLNAGKIQDMFVIELGLRGKLR